MYKVSVVTPFHNVEIGLFKKAYESMKSQSIGFENIQWIVIVHNCEPHYLPALQEMLGQHENIIVRPLDNDARTPSSPRNYGMQFATAPYMGFLDADDSYTPHCLEEAYDNIVETKSDVLIFRRESELEADAPDRTGGMESVGIAYRRRARQLGRGENVSGRGMGHRHVETV